ncbi:hypothetical protein ACRALDRAFT_206918 [Sodiomyces alcalophilus JCM 7366]|uniref:uncharacterized protein n=1 Tax=Sodiomyces alcalophilus JCM 7366 TaxID=591952 RepID=UPI0039B62BF8
MINDWGGLHVQFSRKGLLAFNKRDRSCDLASRPHAPVLGIDRQQAGGGDSINYAKNAIVGIAFILNWLARTADVLIVGHANTMPQKRATFHGILELIRSESEYESGKADDVWVRRTTTPHS